MSTTKPMDEMPSAGCWCSPCCSPSPLCQGADQSARGRSASAYLVRLHRFQVRANGGPPSGARRLGLRTAGMRSGREMQLPPLRRSSKQWERRRAHESDSANGIAPTEKSLEEKVD